LKLPYKLKYAPILLKTQDVEKLSICLLELIELHDICTLSLHHLVSNIASDNWSNKKYYIERAQAVCKEKETECPELNMDMPIGEIREIYMKLREK
jgi:hypothetical protein